MRSFLAQRPNLPPQQSSQDQVKIGGQLRLAGAGGRRMSTHHEQATSGKRDETSAHQLPEPSLYPVANHRRADRTADNKAYLRLGSAWHGSTGEQQVRCEHGGAGPAARAHRALELIGTSHP
jgi:hypothetical protein